MIQVQGSKLESVSASREGRYKKYTKAAIEYQRRKDVLRTVTCLYIIQTEKLYLEGGYTSIYDLGMKVMNVSKGTISNYMGVAKKFMDVNTGRTIFASDQGDFSYLQLVELKKLKKEEAQELVQKGIVKYDSTAKEIKAAVADYLGHIKAEQQQVKEDSIKPIKDAYEGFHVAYNALSDRIGQDAESKKLLQDIMDSVVVLYNNNDRLWS